MNFGSGSGGGSGVAGNATVGAELEQIETEQLGFQAVSGEDKLRLLPSAWPADQLPVTTASLLSVAPIKGIIAAAGPDTLVIASTDSVRQTFANEVADADTKTKSFTPQSSIQVPRVSQVAFSGDESCLVIAAEQGGGLAVYDTNALLNGSRDPTFQLATNGQSVRQILPNPNPSPELSRFFGLVTGNGQLLLADLKEQKLVAATSGSTVFYENVSCACWSRLGKQIVAGLANGTAVQIDPQGNVKAEIPEPPQIAQLKDPNASAYPITSIYWLDTHDFLIIHTPIYQPQSGGYDDSFYHLAHRDKQSSSWAFSKFLDPAPPFGLERKPAQHFIQRLREWGDLNEMLILASTASTDIGLFTRSRTPLDPEHPVVDTFTYTQPPDARRAAMPMGAEGDTSPIGMSLDLSAKEKVRKPIPNDESLDESPVPLPALYVLSNEGTLSMWWVVYNASVRQGIAYPDLAAAGGPRALGGEQRPTSSHGLPSSTPSNLPTFGSAGVGGAGSSKPSPFGAQPFTGSTFGNPSQPTFGTPSTPTFGAASLGIKQSPWGAASTAPAGAAGTSQFGKPAFGASTFGTSTFGQPSGAAANKSSIWGSTPQQSPQTAQQSTSSVFGGNSSEQSPFLSLGGNQGGFAGLGSGSKPNTSSPFAAAANAVPKPSPFATTQPNMPTETSGSTISFGNGSSFGSGSTMFGVKSITSPNSNSGTSTFGKPSLPSSREETTQEDNEMSDRSVSTGLQPFGSENQKPSPFGVGSGGFKLGSTFKGDGSAKDDLPKPAESGAGLFGRGFGDALGLGNTPQAKAASTPPVKKEPGLEQEPKLEDIPALPPAAKQIDDAPLPPDPTTWKPKPGTLPPPIPPGFGDDFIKPEPSQKEQTPTYAEAAPLPPDPPSASTTSRPEQPSISAEDAPLPPDPVLTKPTDSSPAGSPPVDLGSAKFSDSPLSNEDAENAGPVESDDGEDWNGVDDGYDGEDHEGSEEQDGSEEAEDEEEEEQHTPVAVDQKGLSAFEARLGSASPKRNGSQQDESTTPATEKKLSFTPATEPKDSYTPAGLPPAPFFPVPQRKSQESPRSPSPIRSATSPLRSLPSFGGSQSKPVLGQKALFGEVSQPQAPSLQRPNELRKGAVSPSELIQNTSQSKTSQVQSPQRIAVPPAQLAQSQKSKSPAKFVPVEPDAADLEDEEDARIKAILRAPVEPSRDVPAFLAHQDYTARGANTDKSVLGGQLETVFRDINSMVDTLALNARSLQGFVDGNMQLDNEPADRLKLEEEEENWGLGEAGGLSAIVDGIEVQLEDGRLEDPRSAIAELLSEEKELSRIRVKGAEVRKTLAARSDQEELSHQHNAPLPMEVQAQQSELRLGVQKAQTLLSKAEELCSVLRAELASLPQTGSEAKNDSRTAPTVEAVMNTIIKMTAMIEKKSGDVDVLEAQIKRLGGPKAVGLSIGYENDLVASMAASRLDSPAAMRTSRMYAYNSPAVSRLRASRATPNGSPSPRKSLLAVSDGEVEAYRAKKESRRKVMESLREQLEARGPRVVRVGD